MLNRCLGPLFYLTRIHIPHPGWADSQRSHGNPEKLLCSASIAAKIVMRSQWNSQLKWMPRMDVRGSWCKIPGPDPAAAEQTQREAPSSPSITINSEFQPDSSDSLAVVAAAPPAAVGRSRCRSDRAGPGPGAGRRRRPTARQSKCQCGRKQRTQAAPGPAGQSQTHRDSGGTAASGPGPKTVNPNTLGPARAARLTQKLNIPRDDSKTYRIRFMIDSELWHLCRTGGCLLQSDASWQPERRHGFPGQSQ
jgi:hypothetical protein